MFQNFNALLRTVILGGLALTAGWWTLFLRGKLNANEEELSSRDRRIGELSTQVEEGSLRIVSLEEGVQERDQRIRQLELAVRHLKVDHRLARLEVVDQEALPGEDEGVPRVRTRVRFTELDAEGEPLGTGREIEVEGKLVYIEAKVIKFDDTFVEGGDFLRGTSISIFQRIFGEHQRPSEGAELDAAGAQPLVYGGDVGPDPFYEDLWKSFWDYANDPGLAAEKGVRAVHGEAPFIELRPDQSYLIELRSSGGLSIRPEAD